MEKWIGGRVGWVKGLGVEERKEGRGKCDQARKKLIINKKINTKKWIFIITYPNEKTIPEAMVMYMTHAVAGCYGKKASFVMV